MSSDGIDLSKYRTPAAVDFEKSFGLPDDEAERKEMIEKLKASIDLVKAREARDGAFAEKKKTGLVIEGDPLRRHCIPVDAHRGVPARKPGAQKDNTGKRLWKLLPTKAVGLVVDVLGYGAYLAPRPDGTKGYGENNWQGIPTLDYYDAALRHLTAWKLGERLDSASGLPHLAHAACCILFMLAQCEGVDT